MIGLDIEAVRLPAEYHLSKALGRNAEIQRIRMSRPPGDKVREKRELLARSLKLSEEMAPDVHAIARDVQRILCLDKPYEIFQTRGISDAGNIAVFFLEADTIVIQTEGKLLTNLDPDGILVVLAHEFGHYMAHGPDSPNRVSYSIAAEAFFVGISEHLRRLAKTFTMSMELTADRFGMLACQDLDTVLRVEMVQASGLSSTSLRWDAKAYLQQCRELMEETLRAGQSVVGTTHPEHNLRAYSEWLFYESDLYRKLTGSGPGTRAIDDVNKTLAKLLLPEMDLEKVSRTVRFGKMRSFGSPSTRPGPAAARPSFGQAGAGSADDKTETGEKKKVLEGVSGAIKTASSTIAPGISKLKKATAQGVARMVGRKDYVYASDDDPDTDDPDLDFDLDDPIEKDLLDRFAELERTMKEKDKG